MATRSIAAWSASSPRTRPSGVAASRIRSVCPPPPTVASIWRLPGIGDRVPRTSSGMTGRCPSSITPPSVGCGSRADPGSACGATSDPQTGDRVGEGLALERLAVGLPAAGCPHLGVIAGAEDQRLVLEAGESPQVPGTRTRPWRSSSVSKAPANSCRCRSRAFGSVMGRPPTFVASSSHAAIGKIARQVSSHRATTTLPRAAHGSATGQRAVPCRRPHAGTRR